MDFEVIARAIQQHGLLVFLTGMVMSIILGLIKTPLRSKVIHEGLTTTEIKKRESILDTLLFILSWVMALLGAMAYYAIYFKAFDFTEILNYWVPVWSTQSLSYGIWKKLGLKKGLQWLFSKIVGDKNIDGKVDITDLIEKVKEAYSNGELDIDKLLLECEDLDPEEEYEDEEDGEVEEEEALAESGKAPEEPTKVNEDNSGSKPSEETTDEGLTIINLPNNNNGGSISF